MILQGINSASVQASMVWRLAAPIKASRFQHSLRSHGFHVSRFQNSRARIWAVMEVGEEMGLVMAALQIQSQSPKKFGMYWHPHRYGMLYILTDTQKSHCKEGESVFVFTNESFVFGFAQNLWSMLLTVEKPRHARIVAQSHPMPIADIHHGADTIA